MVTEYGIAKQYVEALINEKKNNPKNDVYAFSRGFFQATKDLCGDKANSKLIKCIASYEEYNIWSDEMDLLLKKLSEEGLVQKIK